VKIGQKLQAADFVRRNSPQRWFQSGTIPGHEDCFSLLVYCRYYQQIERFRRRLFYSIVGISMLRPSTSTGMANTPFNHWPCSASVDPRRLQLSLSSAAFLRLVTNGYLWD